MYIAVICFLIFAIKAFNIWKKKGLNLAFSLYALYSLSFISSALMGVAIPHYCDNIQILPTLYILLVLFIWFEPFDQKYSLYIKDSRNKKLANIMLVIMIPTLLYYMFYIRIVLASGLFFVDDNIRSLLSHEHLLPSNTLGSIMGFIASLYFINIILFYVSLLEKWGWKYNTALLLSSLSFPLYCLCYFGRDGVVLWILNFLITFLLFKKYFSQNVRKKIVRILLVFLSLSAAIIVFISLNRFFNEYSDTERNWGGTLGYLGQQLGNFSDVFYVDFDYSGSLFTGYRVFLKSVLGIEWDGAHGILEKAGLEDETNVFKYFVYTLLSGYGYIGGILVSLIFSGIIVTLSKKALHTRSNLYLFIIFTLYQIPLYGVFYYRQGVGRGDVAYTIGLLILLFVYKYKNVPLYKITVSRSK